MTARQFYILKRAIIDEDALAFLQDAKADYDELVLELEETKAKLISHLLQ